MQRGKIRKSVRESFEALGVERVRVLYVHMRDEETGLEESAGTFEEGWKKGEFEQVGREGGGEFVDWGFEVEC